MNNEFRGTTEYASMTSFTAAKAASFVVDIIGISIIIIIDIDN